MECDRDVTTAHTAVAAGWLQGQGWAASRSRRAVCGAESPGQHSQGNRGAQRPVQSEPAKTRQATVLFVSVLGFLGLFTYFSS